ncbi:MAG: hypothetical protein R3C02_00090 [Planctomycetaceae bacterium]
MLGLVIAIIAVAISIVSVAIQLISLRQSIDAAAAQMQQNSK